MEKTKAFRGINHGMNPISLLHLTEGISMMKPVEIHFKEDGSTTDMPSFAIVMKTDFPCVTPVVGEISLEMFNEGLADIGYEIVKKK